MTTADTVVPDQIALDSLSDHSRAQRAAAVDFLAPPPIEIAPVLSAESTLKQGKGPKSLFFRLLLATTIAAAVAAPFVYFASNAHRSDDVNALRVTAVVLALIAFVITWFSTRFKAVCSYVGKDGIARYTVRGRLDAQPAPQVLLFNDAAALYAKQVRHFYNGVYTGTSYDFSWVDRDGRKIYRLKGRYQGKKKPPKQGDPFHFANAADVAWSTYYLAAAQQELEQDGAIKFFVDRSRWLRVGPGFLEFHFGGEPVKVMKEEIASVSLAGGFFSFKHKDAKWYSGAGKFRFSYGGMGNGKVFLLTLDKLMGYRWG